MSIVAMSETAGSLGREIGRRVAGRLGYRFADRDIITTAAARWRQDVRRLWHVAEERPTVLEHFQESRRRYVAFIEAAIFELAAGDDVVLVGRASAVVLRDAPHTLRVRIDAPEAVRGERAAREGGAGEGALARVRESDRQLGARVRFLYHADWTDPLLYDISLNTGRLDVERAARVVETTLADERFRSTDASRRRLRDLSLEAQAQAALLGNPTTRSRPLGLACAEGIVTLTGTVDAAQVWEAAGEVMGRIPGVVAVRNEIRVVPDVLEAAEDQQSHGGFLHGEGHGWGGYGGQWYEREWTALQKYRRKAS
jgi:cytidylate kinase